MGGRLKGVSRISIRNFYCLNWGISIAHLILLNRDREVAPTGGGRDSEMEVRDSEIAPTGVIIEEVVMSQTDQDIVVQVDELREFVSARFIGRRGSAEEDAELVAELQVETDLRGVYSHGTRHAPSYIAQILAGDVNPDPGDSGAAGGRQVMSSLTAMVGWVMWRVRLR